MAGSLILGKDGSCFGELALVYDIPRTATVRALTDCVFLVLEKDGTSISTVANCLFADFEKLRSTFTQINDAIHFIAKERFLTFQKTLFELANTPESMHFTESMTPMLPRYLNVVQTNLLTEIYCIFQNSATKLIDRHTI